jgi:uncharacterized membrane protein YeiH
VSFAGAQGGSIRDLAVGREPTTQSYFEHHGKWP